MVMTPYRFLVMLKPEANLPSVARFELHQVVLDRFAAHGITLIERIQRSGSQLRDSLALEAIYPRLSLLAEVGQAALTRSERETLCREAQGTKIVSAYEACSEFGWSSSELCLEGDRRHVVKLGPGAYMAHMGKRVVINHFFPEFRDRFYSDSATIVAFECETSARGIHELRDALVGHIDPVLAAPGSLRAIALASARQLRLGDVSVARNFFHISAGYIEAMTQLSHLFPARTMHWHLERAGLLLDESHVEMLRDRVSLCNLFAQSEQSPLDDALVMVASWIDGHQH